jgi:hypothetical protein
MKKTFKFFVFMAVLLLVGGVVGYQQFILAPYTYTGGVSVAEVFKGSISLTGNDHEVTIQAGSEVPSVTILGSNNTIRVEEGASVTEIRGLGNGNTVDVPNGMEIDLTLLKGENNGLVQPLAPSLDGL